MIVSSHTQSYREEVSTSSPLKKEMGHQPKAERMHSEKIEMVSPGKKIRKPSKKREKK
jgi:hypothetical protein